MPYLIGPLTNLQWKKMGSMTEFMVKIDPDGNRVSLMCGSDKTLLHDAYKDCWEKVLRNSYELGEKL